MKMHLPFRRGVTVSPALRRTMLLGLVLALGILCGTLVSLRLDAEALSELSDYMDRYQTLMRGDLPASAALGTLWAYFRCAFGVLFLGFCTAGIALIPVLMATEGFALAFSAVAFSAAMGRRGVLLGLAAFGLRCLFVFPCILHLGGLTWRMAMDRKRSFSELTPHVRSVSVCIFFLALGAALEITLVPRLLAMIMTG